MRQETQHTLDKISNLDDENEEYDDSDDEEDFEQKIKGILFNKILGNQPGENQPGENKINNIVDAVKNLNPEEMKNLKSNFGI